MTTIAIVGAGRGLGIAVARKFGAEGFDIALISRSQEHVDALAGDDRSRTPSTRLFQAPQAGQRPTQRGLAAPHSVQA